MNEGKCRRDCLYANISEHFHLSFHGCNYLSITGKSRVAAVYKKLGVDYLSEEAARLLEPENCPCYRWNGKKKRKRAKTEATLPCSEENRRRLRELWREGKTDRQIAEELGMRENRVGRWRRALGLPVNRVSGRVIFDWDRARVLHDKGLSDRQIAEALGCSDQAVWRWRKQEGLLSNRSVATTKIDYGKVKELYEAGLNDREIADKLGCSDGSIYHWRERESLPANVPPGGGRGKK